MGPLKHLLQHLHATVVKHIVSTPSMWFTNKRPKYNFENVQSLGLDGMVAAYKRWFRELHDSPDAKVRQLMHGRKLWFLKPATYSVWNTEIMYKYLIRTDGDPPALRCVQEAGDLIYVPQDWSHGALCLNDCIGVAHEWFDGAENE